MFDQNLHFCAKSFNCDQKYLNKVLKTQDVEELSLALIFRYISKVVVNKTSKLRIDSKPARNQSKLSVCNGYVNFMKICTFCIKFETHCMDFT